MAKTSRNVLNFSAPTYQLGGEGVLSGTKQEYETEYVAGFERNLGKSLVFKARYTDRRLGRIIEDIGSQSPEGSSVDGGYNGGIYNPGPNTDISINEQEVTYTPAQYNAAQAASVGGAYVAPAPGCTADNDTAQAVQGIYVNARNQPVGGACILNAPVAGSAGTGPNGADGTPDGFVKPIRRFNSVEFEFDKRFNNHWLAVVNFRWGNLFGNYEGAYRNDNGQADPGISSLFDFTAGKLGLLGDQFTPGPLSSDRRTVGNIFLSYNFAGTGAFGSSFLNSSLKGFTVGLGARGQSGVPLSILGDHPVYLNTGEIPIGGRGIAGRTPVTDQLDLHAEYGVPLGHLVGETGRLRVVWDMFNVTNSQFETARNQTSQLGASSPPVVGTTPPINTDYNRPTSFQGPFYARGSVRFEF